MIEQSSYQMAILMAMQRKPMYLGTVSHEEVAKRRAANKVARRSRRVNRKRA